MKNIQPGQTEYMLCSYTELRITPKYQFNEKSLLGDYFFKENKFLRMAKIFMKFHHVQEFFCPILVK